MRQLIQSYRTGEMQVEEVPPPALLPGGVLVRTHRSLVSAGTEKMIVDLARKPLLAPHRDSRSEDLLEAAGQLEERWPGRRRATVASTTGMP